VDTLPEKEEVKAYAIAHDIMELTVQQRHEKAKELIRKGHLTEAWNVLLLQ
jgi:hypothetical protein